MFIEKNQLKKDLEDEYKSMLEKNQQDMGNMEQEFKKRLAEAQANVSTKCKLLLESYG